MDGKKFNHGSNNERRLFVAGFKEALLFMKRQILSKSAKKAALIITDESI